MTSACPVLVIRTLVSLLFFITDVDSLGLAAAQGLQLLPHLTGTVMTKVALDRNALRNPSTMPTSPHAAVYSVTRHYRRAIEAAGLTKQKR